ncbi:MAG TPA: hypothetical protein DEA99_04780 [Candidatus Omnitrophica bacterium]|nr:hypothetical protein [Candidatus Omnitrophota bacterium]
MRNLIPEKFTVACDLPNLDYANYLENIFLSMFFTPKHLKLFACGKPSRNPSNKPCEGLPHIRHQKNHSKPPREAKA